MMNAWKRWSQPYLHEWKSQRKAKIKGKTKPSLKKQVRIAINLAIQNPTATPRKKGQGLQQRSTAKKAKPVIVVVANDEGDLFAFTCLLDGVVLAESLDIPKSKMGTCIDSGASSNYCPDHLKFQNFKLVQQKILLLMEGPWLQLEWETST